LNIGIRDWRKGIFNFSKLKDYDMLQSIKKQFDYYRMLGEKAIEQMPDEALFWKYNEESNSVATIVKHLHGNMLSRWTDFLTSDGEKPWRQREAEFDNDIQTREQIVALWNEGWACFYNAFNTLTDSDLDTIIYIRNQGHTVLDAVARQLAHYPYHIGQIVHIGKMACNENWSSLSIPRGKSDTYNAEKFAQERK
jgi:predicted secreted protein